jgi:hypothetical protein
MPTFGADDSFRHDVKRLSKTHRAQFIEARDEFIAAFQECERSLGTAAQQRLPRFPAKIGVKRMVDHGAIMEFRWGEGGRCTWEYGVSPFEGMFHVHWRRIGDHEIYNDP